MKLYFDSDVKKFSDISGEWWNESGKFAILHKINPLRIKYIMQNIRSFFGDKLSNLSLLDIGCGGGLVSESLAKTGIRVFGIDASEESIKVAQEHASHIKNVSYQKASIEDLQDDQRYDVIVILEVLEHVQNFELFIQKSLERLKPGGIVILSTINRTFKAGFFAIFLAEYCLNMIPKNTHELKKFIRPSEILKCFRSNGIELINMRGMKFSVLKRAWVTYDDVSVNYFICGRKAQ